MTLFTTILISQAPHESCPCGSHMSPCFTTAISALPFSYTSAISALPFSYTSLPMCHLCLCGTTLTCGSKSHLAGHVRHPTSQDLLWDPPRLPDIWVPPSPNLTNATSTHRQIILRKNRAWDSNHRPPPYSQSVPTTRISHVV